MKHLALALLIILGFTGGAVAGPVYRAGENSSLSTWLHGEVSAGYVLDSLKLQDTMEENSSSRLHGFNGRALWSPLTWLSVGAEYSRFAKTDLPQTLVDSYQVSRVGGILKLTLAPDTLPRVYVLAGYGRTRHKLEFLPLPGIHWQPVNTSYMYWMTGLGMEINVWQGLFAAVEGNLFYNRGRNLGKFHQTGSKVDTALQIRLGVRF